MFRFRFGLSKQVASCALGLLLVVACAVDERTLRRGLAPSSQGGEGGEAGEVAAAGQGGTASEAGTTGDAASSGFAGSGGSAGSNTGATGAGGVTGASGASSGGASGASSGGASGRGGSGGVSGSSTTLPAGGAGVAGAACSANSGACSSNFAQNPSFDHDAAHWTAESTSKLAWDSRDAGLQPASGSLLISNIAPAVDEPGSSMTGADQCVPVVGGAQYDVSARISFPAQQGAGQGGINLWVFDGQACSGSFLLAATPVNVEPAAAWQLVQGQVAVPTAARSMMVRLVAVKPFSQARLDVLFDDVLLRAH